MKNALRILCFLPLLLVAACSGSSGTTDELDHIPVKDIKEKINRNSSLIETLEASGNIAFDSPEQSGTGWIEIRIKKPDTVYVKIEGPFGISIANALITRGDFTYYNAQENKAITGPSTDINIGAILRIKISFDELISGFTGGFNFENNPADSSKASSENNFYVLQANKTGGKQKFYVDPGRFTIQKYDFVDDKNTSVVEVNYSNYQEETVTGNVVNFPGTIKIKNPSRKQSVYVDYINKEINKQNLSFKVKIPKSAKVIKWE